MLFSGYVVAVSLEAMPLVQKSLTFYEYYVSELVGRLSATDVLMTRTALHARLCILQNLGSALG